MDISHWNMNQVMQLPDCCFGRRYPACCTCRSADATTKWDISEATLPEAFVLWNLIIVPIYSTQGTNWIRLAYGDQQPTTTAEMDILEPVMQGLGVQGAEPRKIYMYTYSGPVDVPMRMPVAAAGRRLILEVGPIDSAEISCHVMIVVSSIPKEAPDWLIRPKVT